MTSSGSEAPVYSKPGEGSSKLYLFSYKVARRPALAWPTVRPGLLGGGQGPLRRAEQDAVPHVPGEPGQLPSAGGRALDGGHHWAVQWAQGGSAVQCSAVMCAR
jgi:hypothetical protein